MYVFLAFPGDHRDDRRALLLDASLVVQDHRRVGIASIPLVYRVIRSATMNFATRDFVIAAKVQGATDRRILVKELLPNIAPIGVSFFLIGIATVVTLEGALAFLGLSVNPPTPSWGNMINESALVLSRTYGSPSSPPWPCVSSLLCLNFIGDRLRAHFDVSEAKL
jgi:peptide/nickel transport system permease protein